MPGPVRRWLEQDGADAQSLAEYAVILGIVAIIVLIVLAIMGSQVSQVLSTQSNSV